MTNTRKILNMLSLLFGMMVLFCFIGFHLGYDGLILVGEIEIPRWADIIIGTVLLTIQLFFIFSYTLNEYGKGIVPIVLAYMPVVILSQFYTGMIFSTILPIIYSLCWAMYRKTLKKSVIQAIKIWGIAIIYQAITILIKIGSFHIGYNRVDMYQNLIYLIDFILLLLIIYTRGGEKHYVGLVIRNIKHIGWNMEYTLYPEEINASADDNEDCLSEEEFSKLQGFKRLKAMSLLLGFQVAQWIIILFVCSIGNVFIEGLVITTSFISFGFIIKRRWHSKSLVICTLSSCALFYIAARITISFQYSQLFPIIVGLALIYTLYRIGIYIDNKTKSKQEQNMKRIKELEKQTDKLWKTIDDISDIL